MQRKSEKKKKHRARGPPNLTHELFHESGHQNAHESVNEDVQENPHEVRFPCATHQKVPMMTPTTVLTANCTVLTKMYTYFQMFCFLARKTSKAFVKRRICIIL